MTHILYVVSTIVGAFSMAKGLTWRHFCVLAVCHVSTSPLVILWRHASPTRNWIMEPESDVFV